MSKLLDQLRLPQEDAYLPARRVWERYGVCDMTLHRWLRDPRMEFPRPVYFGRLRFWRISELIAWEMARAGESKEAA
jgi:predicted DNA-binding transcriptional regulator AlpA